MNTKNYIQIIILHALMLLSQLAIKAAQPQMPPAQVSVVEAKEMMLAPKMQVTGSVISPDDARISTQISAELNWIAEVGTKVKEGDVIARFDPTLLKINLQVEEAALAVQRADLKFRESEVNRFKTLANQDNTSKARLQEEISRRDMLRHDINGKIANVNMAKYFLSQTEIKAPFSGHIATRLASKGEYLASGSEVLRLVDTINRQVAINAPIELLQFLKEGMSVDATVDKQTESLLIDAIVPVGDEVSRMVEIRMTVNNEHWVTGSPVSVSLPKSTPLNGIAIPRDALIIKGSDLYIYRIDNNMKSERIDAEIIAVDGAWVSIKNELRAGDKIIVRGGERLMPGQSVSILE